MSSIKTGLQSEMNNCYCTNWLPTRRSSIKRMKKEKKKLQLLLWLIQTNKYASTLVYICLVANEMKNSEMSAEGKALAEGRIMKINEKHKQMNKTKSHEWISVSPRGEQIGGRGTMTTGCHGDNCTPRWHIIHLAYIFVSECVCGKCLVYMHMTRKPHPNIWMSIAYSSWQRRGVDAGTCRMTMSPTDHMLVPSTLTSLGFTNTFFFLLGSQCQASPH